MGPRLLLFDGVSDSDDLLRDSFDFSIFFNAFEFEDGFEFVVVVLFIVVEEDFPAGLK